MTKGTISVTLRESSRERSRSFFRESFQRLGWNVSQERRRKNKNSLQTVYIFVTIAFSKSICRHLRSVKKKKEKIARWIVDDCSKTYAYPVDGSRPSTGIVLALDRSRAWRKLGGKVGVVARSESILSLTMDRILKAARPPVCHCILETAVLSTWSRSFRFGNPSSGTDLIVRRSSFLIERFN